ncbi:Rne/Rng family ribonuclease [Herbiconiux daphne]|uniref:Rne/Rng family ribonuclease n=1 Tax=Herbiconiux daphne TaxID=2970914 RepID=A0ABT2H0W0_9MICO|nr:Rne/Rng family ribonuclease [Herbiconiux daphne]MCS5733574.1 Rne/Rng family ribonuclease [Herbiconiux daphne]
MVEKNSHNDNDDKNGNGEGTARRKGRLFGGRRAVKKPDAAASVTPPAATTPPAPAPDAPAAPAEAAQPAAAQPAAAQPAAAQPTAQAVTAPAAPTQSDRSAARATAHDDEPGLSPFTVPATPAPDAAADPSKPVVRALSTTSLIFQAPDLPELPPLPPRADGPREPRDRDPRDRDPRDRDPREPRDRDPRDDQAGESTVRRRSRRRSGEENRGGDNDPANTVVKVRTPREPDLITEPQKVKGSTRLEAKKQRRRDGRDAGRRRPVVTEAEFLARREAVDRVMVVRAKNDKIQIGVLEDGVLVEHYVAKAQDASLIGNVYLGRVQNVLPSMEAAFVDIGRGRNAVLYSGEVDWDAAAENNEGKGNQARRIELALKSGDTVLVQVTKDPVGHKGARLTSQVSLPGRYLVYVPNGSMNGISRKLPDTERARLKRILKEVLPDNVGVIVRTASEGATEEQLTLDVNRLTAQWAHVSEQVKKLQAPALLHSEPDLLIKIVRDVFNEDFHKLVISGDDARATIENYLAAVAPDLLDRVERYEGEKDAFDEYRVSEQIEKALDRKVWLPSGGSLVIDRTEAMTVVDVNTGKFVGSGGNLEETVTKNNLEAAEEIVRQLRLRDIGGIIVVDFIDMVLESNRDLVLRRLIECLSRDRTKHQVAEVTSLGLVQMTRKKLGLGLIESFSEPCEVCAGRGIIIHHDPVVKHRSGGAGQQPAGNGGNAGNGNRRGRGGSTGASSNGNGGSNGHGNGSGGNGSHGGSSPATGVTHAITDDAKNALAQIAASTIAAASAAHEKPVSTDAAAAASTGPIDSAPEVSTPAERVAGDGSPAAQSDADQSSAAQTSAGQSSAPQSSADQSSAEKPESSLPDTGRAASQSSRRRKARHTRGDNESAPNGEPTGSSGSAASGDFPAQLSSEPLGDRHVPDVIEAAAAVAASEPAIEILDIPVTKAARAPRVSAQDASHLLDSVLDALPEPKQPGQGRSRSRRVSTAAVSAPVEPSDS